MKLRVLGSNSAGNCYILDNGREALIIEAGVKLREVKKALDFNISRIAGCIVTHEHNDHAGRAEEYMHAGIPVYMTAGTAKAKELDKFIHFRAVSDQKATRVGGFTVVPLKSEHDAAEPVMYLIKHPETGVVLFATDTYKIDYDIPGLNNILIEANYDEQILDDNTAAGRVTNRARVMRSHLEIGNAIEWLRRQDLTQVNNIVLIHLSARNANAQEFKDRVKGTTGKSAHTAHQGMEIEFNATAI